jgi:glutamate dehydrogenase/leucine dehydrogenase
MLDSIDFQTKHVPSAVATVVCFRSILHRVGVAPADAIWVVKGAGAVGGQIIRQVAAKCRRVYVNERLEERREALSQLPNVKMVSGEAMVELQAHAVVFAADSGSLSLDVAHALADNDSVTAVGGPEAGLDRNLEAVRALAAKGKWFVPSVLCGSLGLVSNLDECLGIRPDLEAYARTLEARVANMVDRADSMGRPFHQLCGDILEGRAVV